MAEKNTLSIVRQPVSSSNVASVGYDEESRTLEVEYVNGRVYHFKGWTLPQYAALMAAPSVGRYLIQSGITGVEVF